jgi:hypothetical protein
MVSIDDAHLDHAWPNFSHIVSGFRAARGWSSDTPDGIVSAPADGQTTPTFVDKAVTDAFRDYHHNQAMLRILSKSANLQTASQARRPKIARPVRLARLFSDAGSIPQMGIELGSCLMHLAGDPGWAELVGLFAVGAGFRTCPQEFAAFLRR